MRVIVAVTVALMLSAIAGSAPAIAAGGDRPATVAELMAGVDIPYNSFTLANGLTVIVHEDHKAPIVSVAVWYNVGSKDEPQGRTGFAHLFEHVMILNGTEHMPSLVEPLEAAGASEWNGSTFFDRTNYYETVPTQAVDLALYIESERMGYLLGALTQERLNTQRGVVQNEKRQGDNQPFGLTFYNLLEHLFPEGHPYHHATIGSMADLDAASLEDVRGWFRDNYGPNNAVLVLAGDINTAQARALAQRYFGQIPRGPQHTPTAAAVPTLPAPVSERMHDRVANTRLYRTWIVPGIADRDVPALTVAASALGGLNSSRLDNLLVRGEQTATSVSAYVQSFQRISFFTVILNVKPDANADAVSARLDQIMTDYIAHGPTDDEVQRVGATRAVTSMLAIEQVGGSSGQGAALANGAVLGGDPGLFRRNLVAIGRVTPADARAAMGRWLTRPMYSLRVDPGAREPYPEAQADRPPPPDPRPPTSTPREASPSVGIIADLRFPAVERARLSNGIELIYAHRDAVPLTQVAIDFNAGVASDPDGAFGTQALALSLLTAGANGRNATQIAEQQERLGAAISTGSSLDRSTAYLTTPSANLGLALDLLADVVIRPDFAEGEVTRLRGEQLAAIAVEGTQPNALAARTLPALIFGAQHPYGRPPSGLGAAASVRGLNRSALLAYTHSWLRPETARIFIVSNLPLQQVRPFIEQRFGAWRGDASVPVGAKNFSVAIPAARARIVLVDRPQSPQSVIYAGEVLPISGAQDDTLTLNAANEALGGGFLSRLNQEIRERRGWSYGMGTGVSLREHHSPFILSAPVQADRTGEAIRVMMGIMRDFSTSSGVTDEERTRVTNGDIRSLPGSFETSGAVMGALRSNDLYRRPDNYWTTVASRYRAMTAAQMDAAARSAIDPSRLTWVVVGDASVVRPQLESLGLPVEVVQPAQ